MNENSSQTIRLKHGETKDVAIRIHNTFQRKANAAVELVSYKESTPFLSKNITISIRQSPESEALIYGPATFAEFASQGYTVLETLEPGEIRQYILQTSLNANTPNTFQDHSLTYDFRLGTEELLPPPSPTSQIAFISPPFSSPILSATAKIIRQSPSPSPNPAFSLQVLGATSQSTSLRASPYQKPSSFLFIFILFVASLLFLLVLRDYVRHRKQP
ncbi:MAG: hypothetical protein HZA34_02350 [Candidatus Pacebacteria bacterium]|nr:hypothetical protein [Candidatus Paceibacterota bacterium]